MIGSINHEWSTFVFSFGLSLSRRASSLIDVLAHVHVYFDSCKWHPIGGKK
jgi:hypothetical protein